MRLGKLLESIECDIGKCADSCEVTGVVTDSRQVRKGSVFVAFKGDTRDGASYISNAVEQGAAVVVCAKDAVVSDKVCVVQVDDPRLAAGLLASSFYGNPSASLDVFGITGTNGKTTTAYMTRDILRRAQRNPGLMGTVEYQVGERVIPALRTTPSSSEIHSLLAQMVSAGCGSAVMEVSSHGIVQQRIAGVEFDVAVFTNLSRDHLDYHKSMEEYFEAKAGFFEGLGAEGNKTIAVVNGDDPWGKRLSDMHKNSGKLITFGTSEDCDVAADDIELSPGITSFTARTPWGDAKVVLRLLGRYNVYNALAAIASCGIINVDIDVMAQSLSDLSAVPGRLEEIHGDSGFQVFVDYAHTDDALEKVLATLREITRGRLISVFGCGGDRDRTKRPAMAEVSGRLADISIVTSDNPRSEKPEDIITEICAGFAPDAEYEVVTDRRKAITAALQMAVEGDIVLVAGKGHEGYQELLNTTIPFDDRRVVCECLEEL
ncbi:UDP-N-acetylmuramoyl-L-alanyl-D-glutamate--2,6-diaminopimelate ligase [bacterium B17]|nr:UDP-N-acetylmuramoyl-L-alanyl-D-glutamate--2,6-diaminopimelate ligase [bacterium B17]